jgi:acetylglutamate kinase
MTRVVKIGGAVLGDARWLDDFATAVASAGDPLIIVHGGGPEISTLSERLGVPVTFSAGRRVTSPEALDIASMVLSGKLNKRIVAALLNAGADALGISGEDGGLVSAGIAENGALGRVGVVERVRVDLLRWLIAGEMVPVISPISRGPGGSPLNINADEVATSIAIALGASELLFVTDVAGVNDGVNDRADLTVAEAGELMASSVARDGMAVKLSAALEALAAGVVAVRIGSAEMMVQPNAGTRIRQESEVAA